MFSASIIQAVHILLELDKTAKNKPSNGLLTDSFQIMGEMRRPTLRKVLQALVNGRYIARSNTRRYFAVQPPDKITLLELVRLFHGDVCLGESYDHYLTIGAERFPTEEYRQLWNFESKIKAELTNMWLVMPISTFSQRPSAEKPECPSV